MSEQNPGRDEGENTGARKPRRRRPGFQISDKERWREVRTILQRAGYPRKVAHKARDALHNLVMVADHRTGEVVMSDSEIAREVLCVDRKTWGRLRDALVATWLIRVEEVAVNGETDGRLTVTCLAWYSGEYVDAPGAPAEAPAEAPGEAPAENFRSLNAPTSGNAPEELKNGRTEERKN